MCQDIFPDSLAGTGLAKKGGLLWKIGSYIANRIYRSADKIIVISQDFKTNLLAKVVPEEKIGQPFLPFASIQLDDVELDEGWLLHDLSRGFSQVFGFFEFGRIFLCATALGEAQAAMEDAVAWARERKAFGTPIGQFQQIQQLICDMEVKLTNMRNLVYKAAWEFDNDVHDRLTVAMMKRYVPAAATEVASDAMQILGGRGYTTRKRVSSIWQDCRGFQIAEGTDQIMVYIAAPLIFSRYATEQPPFLQVSPE